MEAKKAQRCVFQRKDLLTFQNETKLRSEQRKSSIKTML